MTKAQINSKTLNKGIHIGRFESLASNNIDALYFPALSNGLCFLTTSKNKEKMHNALQSIILKILQDLRPGLAKLRMYDPNGLGNNLIYLSQLSEKIKGENILTEDTELRRMLTKLTSEIPTIVQKVLGHKYTDKSLVEYNEDAGELARPYNFAAISCYPHSFNNETNKLLFQILESGQKAGFFTFLTLDTEYETNQVDSFKILDKIPCVYEHEGNFYIKGLPYDKYFHEFKFRLNTTLPENLDEIIEQLNRESEKVKVTTVSLLDKLNSQTFWTKEGGEGLDIPIGKINVSQSKNLKLSLDEGDSISPIHCLIGGATGSGKTVLLHNIICNTAWLYSPEEVNLILVDYKEGTEFKKYERLPHVKILSIKSDREFGLSVLNFVQSEFERRGDFFKKHNVKDIYSYNKTQNPKLPRLLVIIDEFQKLLDGSTHIASSTSTALNDIVKIGRSFGVNLILSTQSKIGINTINGDFRSNIGLRIVLQLNNDSDSNYFLGNNNLAPRKISKKGEAIYNSLGGLTEGNSLFQVAYISEQKINSLIEEIRNKSDQKYGALPIKQFIFDGSLKPNIITNPRYLTGKINQRVAVTYLGEAIELQEEHVYTKFRKQNESNLLIVGQDTESAISIFKHTFSQINNQSPVGSQFIIFNKLNVDHELFEEIDSIEKVKNYDTDKQIDYQIENVYGEMQKRIAGGETNTRILIGIYNLNDVRSLRKNGMMSSEMGKKLDKIILDGSGVNIHCMIYSYSYQGLTNTIDTLKGLSNFDTKIALKGGDSTKILHNVYGDNEIRQNGIALISTPFQNEITKFKVYDI